MITEWSLDHMLTETEMTELFKVSRATIWRLVQEGTLPVTKIRGSARWNPTDVQAYLDKARQTAEYTT